ncbi:MAG: hypothetical protein HQL56_09445 [Magnetococcales bacterium]|nr:hypothetical protein [Magnetococcales bacterium]
MNTSKRPSTSSPDVAVNTPEPGTTQPESRYNLWIVPPEAWTPLESIPTSTPTVWTQPSQKLQDNWRRTLSALGYSKEES